MIDFAVEWSEPGDVVDPIAGAWGTGCLSVGGEPLWGRTLENEDALAWSWCDLLEQLADNWQWLLLEQGCPLDLRPLNPRGLRDAAEVRWGSMTYQQVEAEDEVLHRWERRHGLHRGLGALYVRSLFVLREGLQMVVWSDSELWRAPLIEVVSDLKTIGEAIAARVGESDAPQAKALVERWRQREAIPAAQRIRIEAAVPDVAVAPLLAAVQGQALLQEVPVLAAARMTRSHPLTDEERATIRAAVLRLVPTPTAKGLIELTADARAWFAAQCLEYERSYDQGYQFARWLRERLGKQGRIDLDGLLCKWGVAVEAGDFYRGLDAMAVWTETSAAILLNQRGIHSRYVGGRRATLAHEIAHLLLDRDGALPVAEVLGGAVPEHVEVRARAFAAELLAPQEELVVWVGKAVPGDSKLLRRLADRYRASEQLVAWQLINSGALEDWSPAHSAHVHRVAGRFPG